jgi:hypothetical protein
VRVWWPRRNRTGSPLTRPPPRPRRGRGLLAAAALAETPGRVHETECAIREALDGGARVETVGAFQRYTSSAEAHAAAREIAEWDGITP